MHTIPIHTNSQDSRILVGESISNLAQYLPQGKTIIITDENILKIYGSVFPPAPVISIGLGEQNKTLETLNFIFDKLVMYEADRSTFILAIGGGIVCDVAGFAASIYMRGLRYGFVSTTLLSQVDASVGGKNGVNFHKFKNILGVFNQPEFVVVDISMLKTLDELEYISGFAEIIKAAAIKDETLFSYLENNYEAALRKEATVLEKIIHDSIIIKSRVVENDEKEKGERRILNFGHTFAHAIEHITGMLHGEAVSIGMALASDLSVKMGHLTKADQEKLIRLLQNMQLPVSMNNHNVKSLIDAMKMDKKREGENLHMVFLDRIGHAIVKTVSFNQLEKTFI
ncbi:MAG: 3-dehydroquinate synthase [Bacteroidales bacterium]|nr:3-dehydroquinate synthase [Bacteroidales bacterium]